MIFQYFFEKAVGYAFAPIIAVFGHLLNIALCLGLAAIGSFIGCGLAFMVSAIFQGKACSSAILAVSKKPSVFGMSFAAPGIVESFALFALVGGIMMAS